MIELNLCNEVLENAIGVHRSLEKIEPLNPMDAVAVQAMEDLLQYRAIGTVKGYERAIEISIENYNLYKEYKAKVQDFEAIGTIEEFKDLKEKNQEVVIGEWIDTQPQYNNGYYKNAHMCSNCNDYYTTEYDEMKFCPNCGAKMDRT